jgi:alpha-ketoglutarate-dependent taurine dioxygenase
MSWMDAIELAIEPGRPPIVTASPGCSGPLAWLTEHRESLRVAATDYGALLVRGLELRDARQVGAAARRLSRRLMVERDPFTARTAYGDGVYSTSDWPPDQPMCMHHELSYSLEFPGLLVFGCLTAPSAGGATALADGTSVLRDLRPDLVDRFQRLGWELLRTHNDVVGVPWPEAFGSTDRAVVERYCRDNDIEFRWDTDGGLRTRRVRPAVAVHPATGERVWFNQIAFLNEWTLEPAVREYLVLEFGPDGLPFNTRLGNGEPLDRATVDLINEVYEAHTVREPWRDGDLLLVDNLRMAHAREPYEGQRDVVVAMADPVRLSDCQPTA